MHKKAPKVYDTVRGRFAAPMFVLLAFLGAMAWAKSRDPFERVEFNLKIPGQAGTKGIVVLPKPLHLCPSVIYLHGMGGNLVNDGIELRQLAELGIAAVGLEYDQTNAADFDAQFIALNQFVRRQSWAMSNTVAWVGTSLGAQRTLSFAMRNPEMRPQLLVIISGGGLEGLKEALVTQTNALESGRRAKGTALLNCPVLIVHGERDEVFPVQDAWRLAELLRTNGVSASLKILPDRSHQLNPDRAVVIRLVAEYCKFLLTPSEPFRGIAERRTVPFLACLSPAFGWAGFCVYRRRKTKKAEQGSRLSPSRAEIFNAEAQGPARLHPVSVRLAGQTILLWWEMGLRCVAIVLATLAIGESGIYLLTPRFAVTDRTLSVARRYLVAPKMVADFDILSAKPIWPGKRLKTLLEHIELADYNRNELINWKVDDQVYKDFVLSPIIDAGSSTELNWRRLLWENFYPRIRKQNTPEEAAQIAVHFLRERVTIGPRLDSPPPGIESMWKRQITDEKGFEQIYVAALRSVGVGARLDASGRAEFWTGDKWTPAPRPLLATLEDFGKPN